MSISITLESPLAARVIHRPFVLFRLLGAATDEYQVFGDGRGYWYRWGQNDREVRVPAAVARCIEARLQRGYVFTKKEACLSG
jgi:hypothetical protein